MNNRHDIFSRTGRAASALLAAVVLSVIAIACSSVDDPIDSGNGIPANARAGFYLTVSEVNVPASAVRGSRAPGALGPDYDRGEGYENYIDVNNRDFCFLFFDSSDRYVGMLDVESVIPIEGFESSKTYNVVGDLSQAIVAAGKVKIMALANWKNNYPTDAELAGKSLNDALAVIASSAYDFDESKSQPSAVNTIPLYGITNLMTLTYDALNFARVGTIHLLRAFVKIEVVNSPESADDIESVTLTRYNTSGFRAPAGVTDQDKYVHNSYDLDYTAANIPAGVEQAFDLKFEPSASNPTKSFIVYVPEFLNTTREEAERTQIRIHFFKDSRDHSDVIDFKYYQAPAGKPELKDKPFDLLRNYWYRFTVTKKRDVKVEVILVPYADTPLNPDFGLLPPIDYEDMKWYLPVLNPRFDDILFYRNEHNEVCLTPDLRPLPYDPAKPENLAPDGCWKVVCDLDAKIGVVNPNPRNVLYYYYDPVKQIQYAPDHKTPVRTVFSWDDPGFVIYLVIAPDPETPGEYIATVEDYYYDSYGNLWYADTPTKGAKPIPNPFATVGSHD